MTPLGRKTIFRGPTRLGLKWASRSALDATAPASRPRPGLATACAGTQRARATRAAGVQRGRLGVGMYPDVVAAPGLDEGP